MGVFDNLKDMALRAEYERLKFVENSEALEAEINAKYFPKMGNVVGLSSDMAGGSGGITRAVKNYGPVVGKFINKIAPNYTDSGKLDMSVGKDEIVSHFREQYPSAIKAWGNSKGIDSAWGAEQVNRYKKAVQFLKKNKYLPAGEEGFFKYTGDEFNIPKGMETQSVFKKLSPKKDSRTVQAMEDLRVNNPYLSDMVVEDYLGGLQKSKLMQNEEWLKDTLPTDVLKKLKSDQFLKKGD